MLKSQGCDVKLLSCLVQLQYHHDSLERFSHTWNRTACTKETLIWSVVCFSISHQWLLFRRNTKELLSHLPRTFTFFSAAFYTSFSVFQASVCSISQTLILFFLLCVLASDLHLLWLWEFKPLKTKDTHSLTPCVFPWQHITGVLFL